MTNDTTTLNGALRELGETMAANLTTQGVASTWDEGLTTLAGKILDITPVPPTPSFDGITLTGNKNILSAADSEYVTLEAQLTDGGSAAAVSGETVTFTVYKESDDSVVTTLTDDTDSSGLATVSYYGQGTGDIYIQAECTFVSETYSIEDLLKYDGATVDKTSSYVTANLNSHTFSTDKYIASRTLSASPATTYYSLIHETYDLPSSFEASVELLYTSTSGNEWQGGLCISPNYPETYTGSNQCFLYTNQNRYALGLRVNGSLTNYGSVNQIISLNNWYTFHIKVQGTTVTTSIKQGNTVIQSYTGTLSNISSWRKLMIVNGGNASTIHWKNLKVKAL